MTAVLPLRDGHTGKTRLADVLDESGRRRLVASLAAHVADTLLATPTVTHLVVVTADPRFVAHALDVSDPRVQVLHQPPEVVGLNAAVDLARAQVWAERPDDRLLVMHGDLPLLTVADVEALLAAPGPVVLAADDLGAGTNAVLLDPGARRYTYRFGPGSLTAHLAEARRLDVRAAVVRRVGTATDLDTEADWSALPQEARRRIAGTVSRASGLDGPPRPPSDVAGVSRIPQPAHRTPGGRS